VSLDRFLRELVALAPGEEILPGVRFAGASAEVGLRLAFDTAADAIVVDVVPAAEAGARFAAATRLLRFSWRDEGGRRAVSGELGARLCAAVAARAAPREAEALAALRAEAARAGAGETGDGATPARLREVRVERALEPARAGATRFYTLSPYVGCVIGCRFCYAQGPTAMRRRLEALPEAPWGSWVDVRVNAAEVLGEELARLAPGPIKLCPIVSDPYHAPEARYRVTRACLEAIARAPGTWPTFVLTRSRLVTRDVDVLAALPAAWVGVSLPTVDDEARRHFEPRAASVAERLEALAALRAAGVRTFAVVQPLLPGPVDTLADALARTVTSVSVDVLRGEQGASADFAAAPRWAEAREERWQRARLAELVAALEARGVAVWPGELPAELS
jgi:DNA repair photolyase